MKMIYKMILVFSLLAILTTAVNSIYFYRTRMADLDARTYDHLNMLSRKIINEFEQYIRLMDYACETLTADPDFMDAFQKASQLHEESDVGEVLAAQNILSRKLYQEPILEPFFRVSVYSENGFFISSRFEKAPSAASMSDEIRETIAGLPYLQDSARSPYRRQIIGPHSDPWTEEFVAVFSTVQPVTWRGRHVGYVEINASLDDLADIFMWNHMDGFLVQGVFDNGTQFFRNYGDDVVYTDLDPDGMTRVQTGGVDRLVVATHSDFLGMTVYVSQDMTIYNTQASLLIRNYVMVAAGILLVTLLIVTLCSLGLTRAIRQLTRRVKHLPVDSILAHSDAALTVTVTRPGDQEIHNLETTLNRLMVHLQASIHSEAALREGALQAQLNALQMQINPHFIYNTLNIISAKGMECGSEEITNICSQFAQMLRYSADLSSKTATLGDELQNARHYLQLVKTRYEDQLSYLIDVPEDMNRLILPKLTLQPIVENAMTHGFTGRSDPRKITITGRVQDKLLQLIIRDNGNGFSDAAYARLQAEFCRIEANPSAYSSDSSEHLGLINTYLRLLHASNGLIRMQLHNDNGAVVTLTLPLEQEIRHV